MDEATSDLIRRFRAGDEKAFDELAEALAPRLFRLAYQALADRATAEDIAQDALIRIYQRLRALAEPDAFDGWAYRITLNLVHDQFRRRGRERAALLGMEELKRLTERPDGLSDIEREEMARTLSDALGALDERPREVFLLKEVEKKPHAEIARLLGIPEGTVWSRLSYARKALRGRLRQRGISGGE